MVPSPMMAFIVMMATARGQQLGNYYACPKEDSGLDWCHDDDGGNTGYCMVMSTSPSPYKSRCVSWFDSLNWFCLAAA